MGYGKTITLFLNNGNFDNIVTAKLKNWNAKAIKIPRNEVSSCDKEDVKLPGVYFLFCDEEEKSVYIGESENVKERLKTHIQDYSSEKEKFYWTNCIMFVSKDLNKAHIRYLENKIFELK